MNEIILGKKRNILKGTINNTIKTFKTITKKKMDPSSLSVINRK
jgi:hypothetical protein